MTPIRVLPFRLVHSQQCHCARDDDDDEDRSWSGTEEDEAGGSRAWLGALEALEQSIDDLAWKALGATEETTTDEGDGRWATRTEGHREQA